MSVKVLSYAVLKTVLAIPPFKDQSLKTTPIGIVPTIEKTVSSYGAVVGLLLFLVLSVLANTFTFGGTDALGWTDSASYEGSQYTVSRVTATVARETAITAATLGIGTAARGGSAAAQVAYKGILVTEAATGGYQIGKGAGQIAEGYYEAGAQNFVAGGLLVDGSIVSAGAITTRGPTLGNDPTQAPPGTEWRGQPGSVPGSGQGNYYNPATGESFRPDLSHPDPIGPHWDYRAPDGSWYRILPDGTKQLK